MAAAQLKLSRSFGNAVKAVTGNDTGYLMWNPDAISVVQLIAAAWMLASVASGMKHGMGSSHVTGPPYGGSHRSTMGHNLR